MIGTSEGEQFPDSFEYIASRMPPKPLGKPQDAMDPMGPTPGTPEDLKIPPGMNLDQLREYLFGHKKIDEGAVRDPSKNPKEEDGLGGWIDPDSFLSKKGIDMPKSDMGWATGDRQGDRMDVSPNSLNQQDRQFRPQMMRKNIDLRK